MCRWAVRVSLEDVETGRLQDAIWVHQQVLKVLDATLAQKARGAVPHRRVLRAARPRQA